MNGVEVLHTAARRYCMDRAALWVRRYTERSIGSDHPEARDIYPRYNVLTAILVDDESVTPDAFDVIEDLRIFLTAVGQTASDMFTQSPRSAIAEKAMQAGW